MKTATYVTVDLNDVLIPSLGIPGMEVYYKYYPLENMILDLMTSHPGPGSDELFNENLFSLLPYHVPYNDVLIQTFIEGFFLGLDSIVERLIGKSNDHTTYSMKQWLPGGCALLEVHQYDNQHNL